MLYLNFGGTMVGDSIFIEMEYLALQFCWEARKMTKKKTSRKQSFCFEDTPIVRSKKAAVLSKHKPADFFKYHDKVAIALLESLEENDAGAFLEILDAYLKVNRAQVARETDLSRTTVQKALSAEGNPTIRTIAKIVHQSVA